jgi:predicted nucleic-acid-binding protein
MRTRSSPRSQKKTRSGAECPRRNFEDEPTLEESLYKWKESTADFADCLISARHRRLGCTATATFDAKARKLPGFVSV